MFMVKQHNSFLIYALLSRIKLCRDYALFGGHFWQKFDGWGHENILKDHTMADADADKQRHLDICELFSLEVHEEQ